STWSVSSTPTVAMGTSLNQINFSRQNTNNGWAVGGGSTAGIVFKTSDGGVSWTSVTNVPSLSNMPSGVQIVSSTIFITDA
ncbi:hypothetical protein, partial [Mycobacterium tuberculosis]